jgi:DNA topoisomerase-1
MIMMVPSALPEQISHAPEIDPGTSAKIAGLRYVSDVFPGIRRVKSGRGFYYVRPDGKPLRDAEDLARIKSLAIPPAWTDVWICPLATGHLQATGRDAKGRKQYRYHPRWREVRDETKYLKMLAFAHALPRIRRRVDRDIERPGLPREKILASMVKLLEATLIRVGNEEYARQNKSYGLTTLRNRHVAVSGSTIRFQFRGKSGISHLVALHDRRLARIIKRCQDLPGQDLFEYLDEQGLPRPIGSADVNDYIREISGDNFTAKDFRTWIGTVLAALALDALDPAETAMEAKHNIVRAVESVAKQLGNTPSVCRKCYVHPAVIESYMDGVTLKALEEAAVARKWPQQLRPEEAQVIDFLRQRLRHERRRKRSN